MIFTASWNKSNQKQN